MKFELYNRTEVAIDVILEPIGDGLNIPPNTLAEIALGNEETTRLDLYDGQINIWTEGDVVVTIGDTKTEFPALM